MAPVGAASAVRGSPFFAPCTVTVSKPKPGLVLPEQLDHRSFLRDYWQKRPLLMRAALPVDSFRLSAEELAGLACEEEFESRLIIEQADGAWSLRHGPFAADDFTTLPDSRWTLLVQDVDKYLPQVADLIDTFDFIPGWRIDDIMISYATDRGGVGPHADAYDVFLMQAQGRRRWRISDRTYTDADHVPGLEQRILSHFETTQEWVLDAGDVLYLPPGVAHWGTAEGDCMTYSLGFRAPSQIELASDWFQHLLSLGSERRLEDPEDLGDAGRTELTAGVFERAADLVDGLPAAGSRPFRLWLGCYLTEPKPQFQILPPERPWRAGDLEAWLARGAGLHRHPHARTAWARLSDDEVALFYQGEVLVQHAGPLVAARQIAEQRQLGAGDCIQLIAAEPGARDLLLQLINEGVLEPRETD